MYWELNFLFISIVIFSFLGKKKKKVEEKGFFAGQNVGLI